MNLVIVFGPPAVGKMTVGQELSRLTGYKLLHNHMTIDLVTEFFDFGTPQFERLVPAFRQMLVAEAAASNLSGLIFTFVWAFDEDDDKQFLDGLRDSVAKHGGHTYYAELEADLDERLVRNRTENRLKHKKMKDSEKTEAFMVQAQARYRMNSSGDFPYPKQHVKISNTHLSAAEAAEQIVQAFQLKTGTGSAGSPPKKNPAVSGGAKVDTGENTKTKSSDTRIVGLFATFLYPHRYHKGEDKEVNFTRC